MHHVPDVKIEYPVLSIFDAKCVSHIELEFLLLCDAEQFSFGLERNLQLFALSFKICTVLLKQVGIALLRVSFTDLLELFDERTQLVEHWICLEYHGLQHFDRFANIKCLLERLVLRIRRDSTHRLVIGVIILLRVQQSVFNGTFANIHHIDGLEVRFRRLVVPVFLL